MDTPGLVRPVLASNCFDDKENLSDYDLICLSASPGSGKSHHLSRSQVLRFSHSVKVFLTPLHNCSDNFWFDFFDQCEEGGWAELNNEKGFNPESPFNSLKILAKGLNKRSRHYTRKDSLYLVFDNSHLIKNSDLLHQIVYFVQNLNSAIKCVFSGRDQCIYNSFQELTNKKILNFKEEDFILQQPCFKRMLLAQLEQSLKSELLESTSSLDNKILITQVIDTIYELIGGHVGLGILCIKTKYVKYKIESGIAFEAEKFALQLIQSEEINEYCYHSTKLLLKQELDVVSLPLLNRALLTQLNCIHGCNKDLNCYLQYGIFNSSDLVDFHPKPLFRYWLNKNIKIEDTSVLISAIDVYRQYDYWPEAILCAIKIESWSLVAELISQGARHFSHRGQYHQARLLINQLPRVEKQKSLILSLFENLLDFQQYGHQVANSNLTILLAEHQGCLADQQSQELIALLQHHYSFLLQPDQKTDSQRSISQYTQLFRRDNEFCAWAWHSLAMEQVLAENYVAGLNSLIKAIYWAFEQGDAPCVLASLAWIVVPCLQQGKLSFALEYCNKVELWLQQKQLLNFAMVSTVHRVRILIYREQGSLHLAERELVLMQDFYPSLDPLNLAYCYWTEFLLSLALQDLELARKQLSMLEGHVTAHFDSWQLALPRPELLSALLDTLAGSDLAMLSWASQFQLKYMDINDAWLNVTYPSFQSEIIAYVRVRIALGSDMSRVCGQLTERAELREDRLLAMHSMILNLLNASRQGDDAMVSHYRHQLLNRAGILEFHQVYKEYLDELFPLLSNYQVLPSELIGYEKVLPRTVLVASIPTDEPSQTVGINESEKFSLLTKREKQIAQLVLEGLSNKQISESLTIGLATVKGHVGNVYSKLGIKRRAQLANLLYTNN